MHKVYFEILSEDVYLAVAADRKQYVALDTLAFTDCIVLQGRRVCTSHRDIRSAKSDSCLWGIFSSDPAMVLRTCRVARSAAVARAFYLGTSKFLLFHPIPQEARLLCGDDISDTSYFKGFQTVTIPHFCKVTGPEFTLFGSSRVSVMNVHVKVSPALLHTANFSHYSVLEHDVENFISRAKKIVHIPSIEPPEIPLHPLWTWSCVGGVAVALILIFALCICLFVRFRRNVRALQKLTQSGTLPPQPPLYKGAQAPSV